MTAYLKKKKISLKFAYPPPSSRDFAARVLLRHWPLRLLSAGDLRTSGCPEMALAVAEAEKVK